MNVGTTSSEDFPFEYHLYRLYPVGEDGPACEDKDCVGSPIGAVLRPPTYFPAA
jgi:hypothetical protein